MKPIDFKERNSLVAKDQSEYKILPAYISQNGEVAFCMKMNFLERCKLLITGKMWGVLKMGINEDTNRVNPITPIFFTVNKKKDLYMPKYD